MNGILAVNGKGPEPELMWIEQSSVAEKMQADEVLVNIRASAVNRADLMQARGAYPPPPGASPILGLEMAGEIADVGGNVDKWQVGDRVCALLTGGGYAEQVCVHHDMLLPIPDHWSYTQAAAVPEVWYTAFVNLFLEGGLLSDERVLIHAGGSGVGTAAIQLAHAAGAEVYITAGSEGKLIRGRELGAKLAINYKTHDFLNEIMSATDGKGVNVILDPIGGAYLQRNMQLLSEKGRLVCIGLLNGIKSEINMAMILMKMIRIIGSRLRSRPLAEKIEITRAFSDRFWPLLVDGTLVPVIDSVFDIKDAQAAHRYVAENRNTGKVILKISE